MSGSKVPTSITATEPVLLGSGAITTIVYLLQAAGVITVPEAQQLGPQLNAAVVALWPLIIMVGGLIGRHFAYSPATVAQLPSVPAAPQVPPAPASPSPAAPTTTGGSTVAATVESSTPLPAGTVMDLDAGTHAWNLDGSSHADVGPTRYGFSAEVVLSGSIHGTFWQSTTTPPLYIEKVQIPGADSFKAPVATAGPSITPTAWTAPVETSAGSVLPSIVQQFVAQNPGLSPYLAAQTAQVLGGIAHISAQQLTSGSYYAGLVVSTAVPGLIVTSGGLPVLQTQSVPSGTVLANAGLGPGGMGVYVAGAYSIKADGNHESAIVTTILDLGGNGHPMTYIIPGTDITIGPAGSSV